MRRSNLRRRVEDFSRRLDEAMSRRLARRAEREAAEARREARARYGALWREPRPYVAKRRQVTVNVGKVPGRVRPALFMDIDGQSVIFAYFISNSTARRFIEATRAGARFEPVRLPVGDDSGEEGGAPESGS